MNHAVAVQYRILGPLTVDAGDTSVPLGSPKQRLVLALLLIEPDRIVEVDRLIDAVWEDVPPSGAAHNIQAYVSALRRTLPDAITFASGGYRLHVDRVRIDASRFESLLAAGREAGAERPDTAATALREALALWRGTPFADLRYADALGAEVDRLEAMRLSALELRLDADLALGRHRSLVDELQAITREHPFHERFWAQLMLALFRCGRRAEAVAAFARARQAMDEELGVEPSPELIELARRIDEADPSLMVAPAEAPDTTPTARAAVRGFELRDRIGVGRHGEVFAAYQASLGREVAVKVLGPAIAGWPRVVRRFETITRRVARLEHPNVLPLLDAWRDPDGAYLVMPLLSGGDLEAALADGPWELPAAMRVVEQVGGALAHAHRAGLVHGDLDASDVLLDGEGNAFVGDLGLETIVGGTRRTQRGSAPVGSDTAAASIDPDLASLGLLTYRLLTGLPVGQELDGDVSRLRPEVPSGVDQLLRATVSQGTGRAPATIEDFLRALRGSFGIDAATVALGETSEEVRDPFKGLRAFDEADAADFFGRDAAIELTLAKLTERRLVAVIGSSGSGKSSLVRAGLVPAIRADALPGSRDWLISTVVPGPYPFEELARALREVSVIDVHELAEALAGSDDGLSAIVERVLPADSELLLVVDQLEELFSMPGDPRVRGRFLRTLASATATSDSRVRVIATARADFFDRFLDDPAFGGPMRDGVVLLSQLSRDELLLAITGPARNAGLRLETGLAERIVDDVFGRPGALPLLQHVLTELVRGRRGRSLTSEGYEAVGGVLGALGNRAEQVYASLPAGVRPVVRDVFMRLTAIDDEGTAVRRRVTIAELADLGIDRRHLDQVLRAFGAYRLLTFDRDPVSRGPTAEVAHEALFSQWSRLAGWTDAHRDDLVFQRRLALAAAEWRDAGQDPSYTLSGGRLSEFERWTAASDLPLRADERAFLATSRAREDAAVRSAARRRRLSFGALTVLTVVALIFGAIGFVSARTADRERAGSSIRELVARSESLADVDADLSILLAAEAVELARSTREDLLDPAEVRLHTSIAESRLVGRFEGRGQVAWSPNSGKLAFLADLGDDASPTGVMVVDIPSGERVRYLPAPEDAMAVDVSWSPDGRQLIATYDWYNPGAVDPYEAPDPMPEPDPTRMTIWDVGTGARVATLDETPGAHLHGPVFSDDGAYVAVVDTDGLTVWGRDGAASEPEALAAEGWEPGPWAVLIEMDTLPEGPDFLGLPAFEPSGSRIAVGTADQHVRIVDLESDGYATLGPVAGRDGVVDVAWSPDGGSVAAISQSAGGTILPVEVVGATVEFGGPGIQAEVEWSPDGNSILVAGQSGTVTVWDPQSGEQIDELGRHAANIIGLAPSPDGRWLATADDAGEVRVWEPRGHGGEVATFESDDAWMQSAVWTSDERFVVGHGGMDSVIRAWATDGGQAIATMAGLARGGAFPVVASPDANRVAVSGPDYSIVMVESDTLKQVWLLEGAGRPSSFSEDGRYLASGFRDRALIIDAAIGSVVHVLQEDGSSVDSVHFLQGDQWVLVNDSGIGPRLWEWRTGETVDLGWRAGTVAVSRTGTRFAIGGNGVNRPGTRVWDAAEFLAGRASEPSIVRADLPTAGNSAVQTFTPDGRQLLVGFFDRQLTFWDLETGSEVRHLPTGSVPGGSQFSADGRHLLVAGRPTRIYTLDLDELLAIAHERAGRNLTAQECREYLHLDACPAHPPQA